MTVKNSGDGFSAARVSPPLQTPKPATIKPKDQRAITSTQEAAATFEGRVATSIPKLQTQTEKTNVFTQLGFVDDNSEPKIDSRDHEPSALIPENQDTQNKDTIIKSPELIALEKIAPGWGKRINMIDPEKDPELNRMVFEQLVKDLDEAGKSGKVDEDTGRVIVASLLTKINELKESDTKNQYGVKEEATQNIKAIEMEQEFRMLQFQMMLDFIRACFTWYDPETGEKHEPEHSSTHANLLSRMNEQQINHARENNEAVKTRNSQSFDRASLLDKNIHLKKLDKNNVAEVRTATIKDANRIYLIRETAEVARLIQQEQKPEIKDRLIKSLTKKYQEAMPERNINEAMVTQFVQSHMTTEKAG